MGWLMFSILCSTQKGNAVGRGLHRSGMLVTYSCRIGSTEPSRKYSVERAWLSTVCKRCLPGFFPSRRSTVTDRVMPNLGVERWTWKWRLGDGKTRNGHAKNEFIWLNYSQIANFDHICFILFLVANEITFHDLFKYAMGIN